MLVKSSLGNLSGSVGGITWQTTPSGIVARSKTPGPGVRTSRQQAAATRVNIVRQAWRLLSSGQRAAWADFANAVLWPSAGGGDIMLSPHAMFIAMNTPRLLAGLAIVVDGPTTLSLPVAPTIDADAVEGSGVLSVAFDDMAAWASENGSALLIYGARQAPPTVNAWHAGYRYIGAILGNSGTPPASPTNVPAFGGMTEANVTFARARLCRADGRTSPFFVDRTVIQPAPPSGPLPVSGVLDGSSGTVTLDYSALEVDLAFDSTTSGYWTVTVDGFPGAVTLGTYTGNQVVLFTAFTTGGYGTCTVDYIGSDPAVNNTIGAPLAAFAGFACSIV